MPSKIKRQRDMTYRLRCCVCHGAIGSNVIPWTAVNEVGDVIRWHPSCHRARLAAERETQQKDGTHGDR